MKLSIITINFNNASGLGNTIRSVISQTYKDFEYIIIDGGSTDGSKEIIKKNENRISYWVSEPDNGIYNAMNKGIRQAKGEYLMFMNSGDTLFDAFVLENIFSKNLNQDIIYGDFCKISSTGYSDIVCLPERITLPFLFKGTICHQATIISKKLFNEYGLYREDLKIVSDWDFFLKVFFFDRATQIHVPVIISNYQLDGLSSKDENQDIIKQERQKVILESFYKDLLDAYHLHNEYRLFYNKNFFRGIRKIKYTLKKLFANR